MADSIATFVQKLGNLPGNLRKAEQAGTTAVGLLLKRTEQAAMRGAGWPTDERWFGFAFHKNIENQTSATFFARGGFVYMFEKGADGSRPSGKGARRGKGPGGKYPRRGWFIRGRAKAAVMTPQGLRAVVHHPGFRGRPFWQKGVNAAIPEARKTFQEGVRQAMIRTFT